MATIALPGMSAWCLCICLRAFRNEVIYDAEGTREGRYGCMLGLIWVHVRANMGSPERAIIGLESQAVSVRVTKHFVTILVKHVIIVVY